MIISDQYIYWISNIQIMCLIICIMEKICIDRVNLIF